MNSRNILFVVFCVFCFVLGFFLLANQLQVNAQDGLALQDGVDTNPDILRERANFRFSVTCDSRQYTGPIYDTFDYFRGICETIDALGSGAFMVSPGDMEPPDNSKWTIEQYIEFSNPSHIWYPGVGNHELDDPSNMTWLRTYNANGNTLPYVVNIGPPGCIETTYSFDYGDAHFVHVNEYYDGVSDTGTDGDVVDELYDWLANDLATTTQTQILVIGHEPAYPQPDEDSGRTRHMLDSLNKYPAHRDRFWDLLRTEQVTVYITGHSHNYSLVNIDGVWQLDSGHAMGKVDTAALSTFSLIDVDSAEIEYSVYRRSPLDGFYYLMHEGLLDCEYCSTYVFQDGVFPEAGYTGTRDTFIDGGVNHGSEPTLVINGLLDQALLVKWDISYIPPGTMVNRAWITFSVSNTSPNVYEAYEMKRDWQEMSADWDSYSSTDSWQVPGAEGTLDRGLIELGNTAYNHVGPYMISLNEAGVQLVQTWIDDPNSNHGVIITDYTESDNIICESREALDPGERPKLTLFTASINPAEASPTGFEMLAQKGLGTSIQVTYSPAGCASDHTLYWGTQSGPLTSSINWTDQDCFLRTSGTFTFDPGDPPPDSFFYFVIVGSNGFAEGSYGRDSNEVERPEASGFLTCDYPQELVRGCPF